jgi:hypothetical protein
MPKPKSEHKTVSLLHISKNKVNSKKSKALPRKKTRRPIGLSDVKDPTLSRQSAHS